MCTLKFPQEKNHLIHFCCLWRNFSTDAYIVNQNLISATGSSFGVSAEMFLPGGPDFRSVRNRLQIVRLKRWQRGDDTIGCSDSSVSLYTKVKWIHVYNLVKKKKRFKLPYNVQLWQPRRQVCLEQLVEDRWGWVRVAERWGRGQWREQRCELHVQQPLRESQE